MTIPASIANLPLSLDTNWEDLLKQCPMMDPNSPDHPEGVKENNDANIVIKMKDFHPTLGSIYLHKPKPMITNPTVLDSEVWYIRDAKTQEACKLRLLLNKSTSSGFRFLYKYDPDRKEATRMAENDPIRTFTLPLRLWQGSTPTQAEAEQELKLTLMCSIVQLHFFRWRKAMGKTAAAVTSMSNLSGINNTIKYKTNDKGEREESRGPTLTLKTYSQGLNGKKGVPPDYTLAYNDMECTAKVFALQPNKARVRLNQDGIHGLMPQWIAREISNGTRPNQEGDPTKFLFDCESIVHFAKARWAANSASISRYVTQVVVQNLREAGEADFDGWEEMGEDGGDGGESGRTGLSFGAAMSWTSMGRALNEAAAQAPVDQLAGAESTSTGATPVAVDREVADKQAETIEEAEVEAEDDDEEEPVEAPAVVATKPGIVTAKTGAAAASATKSRRVPKK